jgi:tetratricopeptide (TPR) repeat protein
MAVYPRGIKIQVLSKHYLYRILFVVVLFFLSGCSTEKNTRMSRAYHNMTAHYNVYFNGKESLRLGVEKINKSYDDDFSKVLPLFKSSNPSTANVANADMDNAILKGSKLIQTHSITKRLKRRQKQSESYKKFASREEFNNWVDDAYVLMGKAYFYKHSWSSAIENFSYVVRKFDTDPSRYTAYVWLIKCYTETERYVEAYEIIQQMENDEDFPRNLEGELAAVTADYYGRQQQYTEGIPFLTLAVKEANKKEDKLRYKYVLAQWYQKTGDPEKASQTFREISRMNPPYKMAFNARISAAGTFTGTGDAEELRKELRKMLRDKKNLEFRDQIYFAMGNISMKEGNKTLAIQEYTHSASLSSDNLYQRALSCLTLAQIYFDEPEYKLAQSYYDSAMVVIDNKYPNYQQIYERHKSLTSLTDNIYAVEREDSLQRIAQMDEATRNSMIDKWIQLALEKEEKAKKAEQEQMMNKNYFRQNENRFGLSQKQEGAGWYFYNPTTVAYGKVEFERLWGKRKLEDNWRRADKSANLEGEGEVAEDSLLTEKDKVQVKKVKDPKSREFYTQDLPMNDSLMAVSHGKIRNALFNAGRIFKTEFNDYPRSIESFTELDKRYPDNIYTLSSWFELYDLNLKLNDQAKADYYKDLIVNKYPESKYAKYLINPNYFIELEAKADSTNKLYQQAFLEFKSGNYAKSGKIVDQIMLMKPDTLLYPKLKFFKTIADGTASTRENFEKLLSDYIKNYPKAEPKALASEILKLIQDSTLVDYQKLVASGYLNDKIQNSELLPGNQKGADEFGGKFSYDEELLHYFVIAYPKNAEIDLNRLKFDLANYNIDHYTKVDFDIETQNLNSNSSLLIVRSLNNKEQGLIYFRSIIKKREVFVALKNIKYVNFVVSSTNFREITTDKDFSEYLKFFVKNYSRFITGDFSDELLPEPEELLAKAAKEDELPKEKGTFVTINPVSSGADLYTNEETGQQNFVIAVNPANASLKSVISAFDAQNREQYRAANLSIRQVQVSDHQMMIVSSFKTKNEAISYFTKSVSNRKLFKSLDTLSYRNFIITDGNLKKLIETKRISDYLNFFNTNYIGALGAVQNATDNAYKGPYNPTVEGPQSYYLIIPKEEVNADKLIDAIRNFNAKNYPNVQLVVSSVMLDDFRVLFKVEGLSNIQTGLVYLRSIVNDQQVYGPIQNANYRNFIISPANESIFKKDKNILTYMEFYKLFYLKK